MSCKTMKSQNTPTRCGQHSYLRPPLAAALCLGLAVGAAAGPMADGRGARLNQEPHVAFAANASVPTQCAEEDNINIPIYGDGSRFTLEATHPAYDTSGGSCAADFSNCLPTGEGYPFTPGVVKLFDDGETVIEAVRDASWYRPTGMKVAVDFGAFASDIHYIRVYRKIQGLNAWPQVMVFYMDGHLRIIPHPHADQSSVCFGSSVIIGPAASSARPMAEVASVRYLSNLSTLRVAYTDGSRANLWLERVDQTVCRVRVRARFPTNLPFATLRSMCVNANIADAARVYWIDAAGQAHDEDILTFGGGEGIAWRFYRPSISTHNTSAPDIQLRME